MRKIHVIMMIWATAPIVHAAGAGALSLRVETNRVELTAGTVVVRTLPCSLRFTWAGPYGNYNSSIGGAQQIQLDTIAVAADDGLEKRVILTSKPTTLSEGLWQFTLILAAQSSRPGVHIQFAKRNIGNIPARKHHFLRLMPIHFPFYHDAAGEQPAAQPSICVPPWMFWPTANTSGGYGIIFTKSAAIQIITLFPRADWRSAGWYFAPAGDHDNRRLAPGESHTISFRLLPAVTAREVGACYDQFKSSQSEGIWE